VPSPPPYLNLLPKQALPLLLLLLPLVQPPPAPPAVVSLLAPTLLWLVIEVALLLSLLLLRLLRDPLGLPWLAAVTACQVDPTALGQAALYFI
jgi:hypothetical protein